MPTGTKLVGLKLIGATLWMQVACLEWLSLDGGFKVPANDVALPRCIITKFSEEDRQFLCCRRSLLPFVFRDLEGTPLLRD